MDNKTVSCIEILGCKRFFRNKKLPLESHGLVKHLVKLTENTPRATFDRRLKRIEFDIFQSVRKS